MKVIITDDNGKSTEYENFILIGVDKNNTLTASTLSDPENVYYAKDLMMRSELKMLDRINKTEVPKNE